MIVMGLRGVGWLVRLWTFELQIENNSIFPYQGLECLRGDKPKSIGDERNEQYTKFLQSVKSWRKNMNLINQST
jgi:hypothetical protein